MSEKPVQLLVVDDQAELRALLTRYLTQEGFGVAAVADGAAMEEHLRHNTVDLIILDLMLPGEDGLTLARRLRSRGDQPIIIVSARGEEVDRIVGLEVGADDYLAKPFNPRELLARIRAVLRRSAGKEKKRREEVYQFGPFRLESDSRRLSRDGEEIPLTGGEYDLLLVMVTHPNRVLSRDFLLESTKGYERDPYDRSIDVRINRLRKKIEDDPAAPVYLRTVWGAGYLFAPGP
ncbi:MAG: two-component system response regulator OmpR [Gammaproteobacteria bacterium]